MDWNGRNGSRQCRLPFHFYINYKLDTEISSGNEYIERFIFLSFQLADVIAADLTLTVDRFGVLDFSPPFMSFPITILTKTVCAKLLKRILYLKIKFTKVT